MLTLDHRLMANEPDVAGKVIDVEAIIMNLANGHYYSLDGVGAVVWEMLEAGATLRAIVESLVQRYRLAEELVRLDVARLAEELLSESLLRVRTNSGGASTAVFEAGPEEYSSPSLIKYTDMAELLALDPPMPGLEMAS